MEDLFLAADRYNVQQHREKNSQAAFDEFGCGKRDTVLIQDRQQVSTTPKVRDSVCGKVMWIGHTQYEHAQRVQGSPGGTGYCHGSTGGVR